LLGFGSSASIDVILDPTERKKFWKMKDANKNISKLQIYTGQDDISGNIVVKLESGKKFEHLGIRVELIGHLGTVIP
jgi:vacuolar protein sorting-associated protein 26